MVKYIKATSTLYAERDLERLNKLILALNRDRRKLAALDPDVATVDDILNIKWESYTFWSDIAEKQMNSQNSIEDVIDYLIDNIHDTIKDLKAEREKDQDYTIKASVLKLQLNDFLDANYNVIDEPTQYSWIIEPISDNENVVEFVDSIVDAIDGKYYGTGRGGSWTAWDLLSDTGVHVKAGKAHNYHEPDCWYVEIQ